MNDEQLRQAILFDEIGPPIRYEDRVERQRRLNAERQRRFRRRHQFLAPMSEPPTDAVREDR